MDMEIESDLGRPEETPPLKIPHQNLVYQLANRSAGYSGRFHGTAATHGAHTPHGFLSSVYKNQSLVSKLSLHKELKHHRGCVNAVSWSTCGRWIASGSDDTVCCLWDWHNDGKPVVGFNTGHTANIFSSQFMPMCDNTRVVTCAGDHQVRAFNVDLSAGKMRNVSHVFTQHRGRVKKLATFPDDPNTFLSCAEDGTVRLFDLREGPQWTGKKVVDMSAQQIDLTTISLSGNYFAVAGSDPLVYVFDIRSSSTLSGSLDCVAQFGPQHITSKGGSNYSADGHITNPGGHLNDVETGVDMFGPEILASYSANSVFLFDLNKTVQHGTEEDDPSYENEYSGHCNIRTVKSVSFFGPRAEYVMSGSDDGRIFIWDKKTAKLVNMMKGDREVVNVLSGHPFDPVLATVGIDKTVKIWTPNAEYPTDLSEFQAVHERNQETTRSRDHAGRFISFSLLSRLMRAAQRRQGGAAADDETLNLELSDEDDDEDGALECNPQ